MMHVRTIAPVAAAFGAARAGITEIGWHQPGHYGAGMKVAVTVQ